MLACARLGAAHSVVFGGFSPGALKARVLDAEAQAADHLGRAVPPRQARADEGEHRRGGRRTRRRSSTSSSSSAPRPRCRGPRAVTSGGTRSSSASQRRTSPRRSTPRTRCSSSTPRARPGTAQGHPAHLRRLPHPGRVHPPRRVRPQARRERLLVHRRHRLGHRAQLHRLRAAGEPGDVGDVRGHAEHPARGPALGDHPEVRRHDLLHRPHADPHVHEVGQGDPREVRPVVAAGARQRR